MLELLSYSVKGLKDKHKRSTTFCSLREKNCDMILLQATRCHLRKNDTRWGGNGVDNVFGAKEQPVARVLPSCSSLGLRMILKIS